MDEHDVDDDAVLVRLVAVVAVAGSCHTRWMECDSS